MIHNEKNSNCIISNLEAKVESLKGTIVELNVKIGNLEKELQTNKTQTSEINVVASEEFKCDMCGVVYKKEATLRKHINTKHQLDPAEVDTIIQNDSNKKELKKAKRQIRELQDKVEDLTLGQTKLKCEAKSLKAESDSLMSLHQNTNNTVPFSKPSTKKKK